MKSFIANLLGFGQSEELLKVKNELEIQLENSAIEFKKINQALSDRDEENSLWEKKFKLLEAENAQLKKSLSNIQDHLASSVESNLIAIEQAESIGEQFSDVINSSNKLTSDIKELGNVILTANNTVDTVNRRTQEVIGIVDHIQDIAMQSKLLLLMLQLSR